MRVFSASPLEMVVSLWRNRALVKASVYREVLGRYRGSLMGLFWSFFNPLLMLGVYTFIFSGIFKARWGVDSDSNTEFALVLFAGLIMYNLFSECVTRAPGLILSNINYVKKVVFPLEILPFVTLLSALFHWLISLGVWFVVYGFFYGVPHPTVIYLPLIVLPFVIFIMGLGWLLASLGVYLRDVTQIIGIIITALMFMSPIFYPASAFPEDYRYMLYLNPLTPVVELTRDVLFWGKAPAFGLLVFYYLASAATAWLGFVWFQKTRKGFSDVL